MLMRYRLAWLRPVLAALLIASPSLRADDPKVEGDLKKLQGKWTATAENGDKIVYTFKGNTLKVESPPRNYTMSITLDSNAKPEKTIDLKIDEGPEDAEGRTSKGIYKFDGEDKFIFCFSPEGDRPTKFEQEGYEKILTETRRVKE